MNGGRARIELEYDIGFDSSGKIQALEMCIYMLGGIVMGGSTVDVFSLSGMIDQVSAALHLFSFPRLHVPAMLFLHSVTGFACSSLVLFCGLVWSQGVKVSRCGLMWSLAVWFCPVTRSQARCAVQAYAIPAFKFQIKLCKTNRPPHSAVRAPGKFESPIIMEHIIEHVAARLNLEAAAVRELNFLRAPPAGMRHKPLCTHVDCPTRARALQLLQTSSCNQALHLVVQSKLAFTCRLCHSYIE